MFLLVCSCLIVGVIAFNMIGVQVVSHEVDSTLDDVGDILNNATIENKKQEKSNESLQQKVAEEVLAIIESNQKNLDDSSIPEKYLNGQLIGVSIHKDGVFLNGITMKQWLVYVMSTNKEVQMEWIYNMGNIDSGYEYIVNGNQGIRFKFQGKQSSIILFNEEMGELYPSFYSKEGGSLLDLAMVPDFKKEANSVMTLLTDPKNLRLQY